MRETGYLSGTADPNAQDQVQGFNTLNGMIDSMAIDGLNIFCRNMTTYALTSGTQSYDIGLTATAPFNVARPSRIINANIVSTATSPNTRFPLRIIDDDEKMSITVQGISSSLPSLLNYKASNPNGVLWFWPKPAANYSVELETWVVLAEFTDLVTNASFPPGYYDLLVYGLAQRFCSPGWGLGQSPEIDRLFEQAKQRVTSLNMNPTPMQALDPRIAGVRRNTGMGVPQQFIDSIYPASFYR